MLYTISSLEMGISPATSASLGKKIYLLCHALRVGVRQANVPDEQVGIVAIKEGTVTAQILHKCDFNGIV